MSPYRNHSSRTDYPPAPPQGDAGQGSEQPPAPERAHVPQSPARPATPSPPSRVPQQPSQAEPPQQQQYQQADTHPQASAPQQTTSLQTTPGQVGQRQNIWLSRPHMPQAQEIPEEAKRRHAESKRLYPDLNLSRGEFIIKVIHRHQVGLLSIWFTSGFVALMGVFMLLFVLFNQSMFAGILGDGGSSLSVVLVASAIALLLVAMGVIGGFIATYVYKQNKFILTNESVVQQIQRGLFSRREQTVSLQNVEDASYNQHGIIQHILNFGDIRLSTEGEETTYRFSYVRDPKHQIALLNNAVEAFKNGRPVMHLEE